MDTTFVLFSPEISILSLRCYISDEIDHKIKNKLLTRVRTGQ